MLGSAVRMPSTSLQIHTWSASSAAPMMAAAKYFRGEFKVVLEYTTQLKFTETLTLERKNSKIILNNLILPSEKIIIGKKSINYLVMSDTRNFTNMGTCYAGHYSYTKIKNKTKTIERGCIGTTRYAKLLAAFRSI